MVAPLVAIGLGSLAASGITNMYRGFNSANAYRQFANGYKNLDRGYRDYLARNGRKINPNRAINSFYGRYLNSQIGFENSFASSVGAGFGTFGAGAMTSRWL